MTRIDNYKYIICNILILMIYAHKLHKGYDVRGEYGNTIKTAETV